MAAFLASFIAQTYIGLVPCAAGLFLIAIVSAAAKSRLERGVWIDAGTTRAVNLTGWLLILLWSGPIAEQMVNSPGNLTQTVRFFGQSHARPPIGDAFVAWAVNVTGTLLPRFPIRWRRWSYPKPGILATGRGDASTHLARSDHSPVQGEGPPFQRCVCGRGVGRADNCPLVGQQDRGDNPGIWDRMDNGDWTACHRNALCGRHRALHRAADGPSSSQLGDDSDLQHLSSRLRCDPLAGPNSRSGEPVTGGETSQHAI